MKHFRHITIKNGEKTPFWHLEGTEIMFDKCLILCSSPFFWKKINIMIIALPALKWITGSLSAFIFLAQAPASFERPFPS